MENVDVIVIGAGAAGLFCAAQIGKQGHKVLVVDKGKRAGRKILMSGGGRCNFTNLHIEPAAYLSQNPHFCKSALARYSQWDFIDLVSRYQIAYQERKWGQLFCEDSAQQIVDMLLSECAVGGVKIHLQADVLGVTKQNGQFLLQLPDNQVNAKALIVATGGLSLPNLGATPLGYQLAQQFGLQVIPTRAGLVPLTLHKPLLEKVSELSGVAIPSQVTVEKGTRFRENLLFTHRGLSGPAILQISNYWQAGETVSLNLLPDIDVVAFLNDERSEHANLTLKNSLAKQLPKRLVEVLQNLGIVPDVTLKQLSESQQMKLVAALTDWKIYPNGTEGYRTAEVTLGGVDTQELSSKTMAAHKVSGLYFIGEVVDVTGWLGGYNFQWAWSSAWACAQAVSAQITQRHEGI